MAIKLNNVITSLVKEQKEGNDEIKVLKDQFVFDLSKVTPQQWEAIHPQKRVKLYRKISEKEFYELLQADPTNVKDDKGSVKKPGKYAKWIISKYVKLVPDDYKGPSDSRQDDIVEYKRQYIEDLHTTNEMLEYYDRHKDKLDNVAERDIWNIPDLPSLQNIVAALMKKMKRMKVTGGIETSTTEKKNPDLVYHYIDENYDVVTPKDYKASQKWFGFPIANWCTAGSSAESNFNSYMEKGGLWIIRDRRHIITPDEFSGKGAGEPMPLIQINFESYQFKKPNNKSTDVENLLEFGRREDAKGVMTFLRPHFAKLFANKTQFDVNDQWFTAYVAIYGKNAETDKMIKDAFKINISRLPKNDQLLLDFGKEQMTSFLNIFKFEELFPLVMESLPDTTRFICIQHVGYKGEGIDILPEHLTRFKNLVMLDFEGFVKDFKLSLAIFKNLKQFGVRKSPHIKRLPEVYEVDGVPQITLLNIDGSPQLKNDPLMKKMQAKFGKAILMDED